MKRILPILTALVLISSGSFSQVRVSGYTSFSPAFPLGEYKDNNASTAWGGRLGILVQPNKKTPVKLGIELGYMTQGFQTQYFNSINFSQFADYRVRARLNIFSGLFNMRLQNGNGKQRVKPFVEGLIGWNNFYGTTKLQQRNPAEDYEWDTMDRESTKGYWSLTYGGSAGFDISLDKEKVIWLECKVAYLRGSNTMYYTNPSVDANGHSKFTLAQSETDMLIPQIGLKFGL
ncbi:MAG: hypothetical protein V4557_03440 [Bacteroidota bacterium]